MNQKINETLTNQNHLLEKISAFENFRLATMFRKIKKEDIFKILLFVWIKGYNKSYNKLKITKIKFWPLYFLKSYNNLVEEFKSEVLFWFWRVFQEISPIIRKTYTKNFTTSYLHSYQLSSYITYMHFGPWLKQIRKFEIYNFFKNFFANFISKRIKEMSTKKRSIICIPY